MKKALSTIAFSILVLAVIVLPAYGWISNIVKLYNDDFSPVGKSEIIRIIGIPVAPLGMVIGYITLDEEVK